VQDRNFQAKVLGIQHPCHVVNVALSMKPKRIETFVEFQDGAGWFAAEALPSMIAGSDVGGT